MKLRFISLLVIPALIFSCQEKEFEAGKDSNSDSTSKLVGNAHQEHISGSILILADEELGKQISDGTSEIDARITGITPVFSNTDSDAARRNNLHLWYEVSFDSDIQTSEMAETLAGHKNIRKVQYNSFIDPVEAEVIPYVETKTSPVPEEPLMNDPLFPEQWNLLNDGTISPNAKAGADIAVYNAWTVCKGDPSIVVAIIDSGISTIHTDLRNSMWTNSAEINGTDGVDDDGNGFIDDKYGYNFLSRSGSIVANQTGESAPGHGTHVAGIIGATSNNGKGISGIAGGSGNNDGVRLMSCQIFQGSQNPTITTVASALKYAADNGAAIASCSFGSPGGIYHDCDDDYKESAGVEYDAIRYFIDPENANCDAVKGNIIVFSTGNNGNPTSGYPGALQEVIGVSAFGPDMLPTAYTNYGPGCNISAPGGDYHADPSNPDFRTMILSTIPNGLSGTISHDSSAEYGYMQGTSQACPHVAGVAALGMSHALHMGKSFSHDEFVSMLLTSTNDINSLLKGTKQTKKQDGYNYVDFTLNLDNYYGKMGTGAIDAWKLLMQVEGTPSVIVKTGETCTVDLDRFFGEGAGSLTYLYDPEIDVLSKEAEDALGLAEFPQVKDGKIELLCTKVGSAKIKIRAIAGGDHLGGGNSIGGREIVKDVAIASRGVVSENGGWF